MPQTAIEPVGRQRLGMMKVMQHFLDWARWWSRDLDLGARPSARAQTEALATALRQASPSAAAFMAAWWAGLRCSPAPRQAAVVAAVLRRSGLDEVSWQACKGAVGDLSEALALVLPVVVAPPPADDDPWARAWWGPERLPRARPWTASHLDAALDDIAAAGDPAARWVRLQLLMGALRRRPPLAPLQEAVAQALGRDLAAVRQAWPGWTQAVAQAQGAEDVRKAWTLWRSLPAAAPAPAEEVAAEAASPKCWLKAVLVHAEPMPFEASQRRTPLHLALWNRPPNDAAEVAGVVEAIARGEPPPADPQALRLVTVSRCASALGLQDWDQLMAMVRTHTVQRFGPVRSLRPGWVLRLEVGAVAASRRHQCGFALGDARAVALLDDDLVQAQVLADLQALAHLTGAGAAQARA